MAPKPLPSREELLQLLRYDGRSGRLYYRARSPDMFPEGHHGREHSCAKWNTVHAGTLADTQISNKGYRRIVLWQKRYAAHRIIWKMIRDEEPPSIDHESGNQLNNRIRNMRATDALGNAKNLRLGIRNKSGAIGVHWCQTKQRWIASIKVGARRIKRAFSDFESACASREKLSLQYGYHPNHGRLAPSQMKA